MEKLRDMSQGLTENKLENPAQVDSAPSDALPGRAMPVRNTDVVIVGAGPCGLFSVFQLGLLGLNVELIDILDGPGGQCRELYPDKPIYDIPALPVVTAAELVDQLMEQIKPFEPIFHYGHVASTLRRVGNHWHIGTDRNLAITAPVVVIAAGGGRFSPKQPAIPGIEALTDRGVSYAVRDRSACAGKDIVVAGGGDSAVDWAINLSDIAKSVTVIHRRSVFRAAPASVKRLRELEEAGRIDVLIGQTKELITKEVVAGADQLVGVRIRTDEGMIERPADLLLPFFGLTMKPGPLLNWGIELVDGLIPVDTARFETSLPGVFAVGDINTYPGKLKLILSGFHEAALMAQAAKALIHPDERVLFQYTTSSTALKKRLKVL